jgi:hypothetical protein
MFGPGNVFLTSSTKRHVNADRPPPSFFVVYILEFEQIEIQVLINFLWPPFSLLRHVQCLPTWTRKVFGHWIARWFILRQKI